MAPANQVNLLGTWARGFMGTVFLVVLLLFGLYAYKVYFALQGGKSSLACVLITNPAANIGIPASAVAAFAVVSLFMLIFPPEADKNKTKTDTLKLSFFGQEFTGPSGPTTLWVLCFLSFVLAMHATKIDRSDPKALDPSQQQYCPEPSSKTESPKP